MFYHRLLPFMVFLCRILFLISFILDPVHNDIYIKIYFTTRVEISPLSVLFIASLSSWSGTILYSPTVEKTLARCSHCIQDESIRGAQDTRNFSKMKNALMTKITPNQMKDKPAFRTYFTNQRRDKVWIKQEDASQTLKN
jgi:hypothetical protein